MRLITSVLCAMAIAVASNLAWAQVPSTESTKLEPIRYAKVKASITKMTFEKIGTRYEWKEEIVCTKEAQIGVYDERSGGQPDSSRTEDLRAIQCASIVGGKPTTVAVGGMIGLIKSSLFPGEPLADFKSAIAFLLVGNDDSKVSTPSTLTNGTFSRDLGPSSIGFVLVPKITQSCQSSPSPSNGASRSEVSTAEDVCTTNLPEYFLAVVEMQD